MIAAPVRVTAVPGPLAAADEDELAAAAPALSAVAPTLSWAATELGVQPAVLEALERAGELLVIPGPWPVRQAYAALGGFVPAWQLDSAAGALRPGIAALVQAAAAAGWTSLDLHRFMTAPAAPNGETPAEIFAREGVEAVLDLLRRAPRRPR